MRPSDRPVKNSASSDPRASEVIARPYQRPTVVEITPAMEAAGFEALCLYDSERGDPREAAIRVYQAMEAARGS